MKLLTASRIKLASKCVAWLHEDGPAWGPERPTYAMKFGTALHTCIERELTGESWSLGEVALEYALTERQRADLEDYFCAWFAWKMRRPWLFENVEVEIPFAFDPETGIARRLPKGSHREYIGAKPYEICGTVDALAMVGDHPVVIDWKTGGYGLPAPIAHEQTRTNALLVVGDVFAARPLNEMPRVTGMLVAIRADRVWHESDEMLWAPHLYQVQEELRAIHKRRLAPIEFNPGTHCKDCPALNTCKAHKPKEQANERMG